MSKESNLKERFKIALLSTAKVISDDYKIEIDKKNRSSKNMDFFELDNLSTRFDFIKYRAEIDSKALRKKFSNDKIYRKNSYEDKLKILLKLIILTVNTQFKKITLFLII